MEGMQVTALLHPEEREWLRERYRARFASPEKKHLLERELHFAQGQFGYFRDFGDARGDPRPDRRRCCPSCAT